MDIPQTSELSPLEIEPDERERITALTRSLPRHSLVKAAILRYFDGEAVPSAGVLIEGLLEGRTSAERTVSAWALGVIPISPDQLPSVVEALSRSLMPVELNTIDRDRRVKLLFSGGMSMGLFVLAAILAHVITDLNHIPILDELAGLACFAGLPFWVVATTMWSDHQTIHSAESMEAAKALGDRPEAEGIEALAAAIGAADSRLRGAAIQAFIRKAGSVAALPYGSAGSQSIKGLCRALTHQDSKVIAGALNALCAVGGASAIQQVEWLVGRPVPADLKNKARETLAILEERKKNEAHSAVLLRPTYQAQGPNDRLLHIPAHAVHAQDLLLRPSDGEEACDAKVYPDRSGA